MLEKLYNYTRRVSYHTIELFHMKVCTSTCLYSGYTYAFVMKLMCLLYGNVLLSNIKCLASHWRASLRGIKSVRCFVVLVNSYWSFATLLTTDFSCALSREILLQGRMYISQGWFCFYSNIFGWETQVTIDCTKVVSITREKTAYVVPNAILICTEDEKVMNRHEESFRWRHTLSKVSFYYTK